MGQEVNALCVYGLISFKVCIVCFAKSSFFSLQLNRDSIHACEKKVPNNSHHHTTYEQSLKDFLVFCHFLLKCFQHNFLCSSFTLRAFSEFSAHFQYCSYNFHPTFLLMLFLLFQIPIESKHSSHCAFEQLRCCFG